MAWIRHAQFEREVSVWSQEAVTHTLSIVLMYQRIIDAVCMYSINCVADTETVWRYTITTGQEIRWETDDTTVKELRRWEIFTEGSLSSDPFSHTTRPLLNETGKNLGIFLSKRGAKLVLRFSRTILVDSSLYIGSTCKETFTNSQRCIAHNLRQ